MSALRPFGGQLDSFQQLVDSFFGRNNLPALSDTGFNMPATDISENDDSYTISAELPGIKKEDVNVSLHEGVLSIEAESKSEHEEKGVVVKYYWTLYEILFQPLQVATHYCVYGAVFDYNSSLSSNRYP